MPHRKLALMTASRKRTQAAFVSALWAIVKSTIYVWAEEGRLPDSVDESVMQHAFVHPGHRTHVGASTQMV